MAITNSIFLFVGTIAVASSISEVHLCILLQEVREHLLPR